MLRSRGAALDRPIELAGTNASQLMLNRRSEGQTDCNPALSRREWKAVSK